MTEKSEILNGSPLLISLSRGLALLRGGSAEPTETPKQYPGPAEVDTIMTRCAHSRFTFRARTRWRKKNEIPFFPHFELPWN